MGWDWDTFIIGVLTPLVTLSLGALQYRRNRTKLRNDTEVQHSVPYNRAAQDIIKNLQDNVTAVSKELTEFKKAQEHRDERHDKEIRRLRNSEAAWRQYAFTMERWANKAYMLLAAENGGEPRIESIPQAPSNLT